MTKAGGLKFDFEVAEVGLVEYKGLYYDAKVLKQAVEDGECYYFIHYIGWSKKRDEWVWTDRIMKKTETNERKSAALHAKAKELAQTTKRRTSSKGQSSGKEDENKGGKRSTEEGRNKRDADSSSGTESSPQSQSHQHSGSSQEEPEVKNERGLYFSFPHRLIQVIVEDFLADKENNWILEIPAAVTVQSIFKDYVASQESVEGKNDALSLTSALENDLNALTVVKLSYKSEIEQLKQIEADGTPFSTVLGAHHLLRLLTILGDRLVKKLSPEDFQCIVQDMETFIEFLDANFKKYFTPDMDTPPGSPEIGTLSD